MFVGLRDPKTHPVLLIFALKAHWREKYGGVPEVDDTTAQETLAELRKLGRRAYQRREGQGDRQTQPNGSQPRA